MLQKLAFDLFFNCVKCFYAVFVFCHVLTALHHILLQNISSITQPRLVCGIYKLNLKVAVFLVSVGRVARFQNYNNPTTITTLVKEGRPHARYFQQG